MAKERIREAVRLQVEQTDRFFVGEVEVTMEWLLHEERRWDTPGVLRSPDVDNVVKPLLDGLCGPRGLLLDDCQVQSIHCSWIDWPDRQNQQITIRIRPLEIDDWVSRGPITGLRMSDGMCWVIGDGIPSKPLIKLLELVSEMREVYAVLLAERVSPEQSRYVLPAGRRFHPDQLTRHGFPVRDFDEYLSELKNEVGEPDGG